MNRALLGVIVFTVIEIVTMAVWLALVLAGHVIVGTLVLIVGLFVEHYVSINVGAGRPPFGPLPPDRR